VGGTGSMGAHRELLPAPWREPVAGRTRGGSAGGVRDDEAAGSGRGEDSEARSRRT
jgi:hypothetical protein